MGDLLDLSARFIDGDAADVGDLGPVNRINLELSELADGLAMVESFSHVVAFRAGDGLVLFDATHEALAPTALSRIRGWDDGAVSTIVYTHGHIDHVGGGSVIVAEAAERGDPRRGSWPRRPCSSASTATTSPTGTTPTSTSGSSPAAA